jgi:futalosine hydrolase
VKIRNIVVLSATHREIDPFLNSLHGIRQQEVGKRPMLSGFYGKQQLHTIISNPGLVNAVQALAVILERIRPSLIIQTGCAGAFKQSGLNIGDIGLATEEIDIHLGLEADAPNQPLRPLPFPVLKANQKEFTNQYPLDRRWTEAAFKILAQRFSQAGNAVIKGPFLTVSTITASDEQAAHLYNNYHACMEQMEGSGTAHLALLYNIPCIEIRCASNWVGNRNLNQWDIPRAASNVAKALLAFFENLPADI